VVMMTVRMAVIVAGVVVASVVIGRAVGVRHPQSFSADG
jgi:hypothetical protein